MDASLVTPSGLRKLTSELESLREKRQGLSGSPDRAQHEGASGFSAELPEAKEWARLERQIEVLEHTLASAIVVHPDPRDGELEVGELARLRDLDTGELVEYRIVGAGEINPGAGSISYASPIGSALLGRRAGEVIEVPVPSGVLRLEVLEIEI
jgi:transcription elongation factor GreA